MYSRCRPVSKLKNSFNVKAGNENNRRYKRGKTDDCSL